MNRIQTAGTNGKAPGILLLFCVLISLCLANSSAGSSYISFWQIKLAGHSITFWINEGLMSVFFLLIGLELEKELYTGSLSSIKKALLPVLAALGGMLFPAGIHYLFNHNQATRAGAGIPMATDIAFALAVLSITGRSVQTQLKVFLTAFAVIDDLGAIITIALFYSSGILWIYLAPALFIIVVLFVLKQKGVTAIVPYVAGGVLLWYFMLHSGVHATIAGVLVAFAVPYQKGDERSASTRLHQLLEFPVIYIVLPLFALANTPINISGGMLQNIFGTNGLGIILGLVAGKPAGIFLFSYLAVKSRICSRPEGMEWSLLAGAGFLGGIGFTMSIFISILAFSSPELENSSRLAVLCGSVLAAVFGITWLGISQKKNGRRTIKKNPV